MFRELATRSFQPVISRRATATTLGALAPGGHFATSRFNTYWGIPNLVAENMHFITQRRVGSVE